MTTSPPHWRRAVTRRMGRFFGLLPGLVFSIRVRFDSRPAIVYISDGASWVLDDIGYNLTRQLGNRYLMRVTARYRGFRDCLLHFAATPIYLKQEAYRDTHPSNWMVMTWTHGLPNNPDPNIQLQITNLEYGEPYLDRIHVSTRTAREFLISQGISEEKVVHIPFGIDVSRFHVPTPGERAAAREKLGIPQDAICIGSFQKDSPGWDNSSTEMKAIKGPDILAGVLERLAERYPIFVLLTAPARGYVISRLERKGIPYRHQVPQSPDEMARLYHALDVYLITSRDEGGPLALLEAMASGVPVVSTRMGLPKDAIEHKRNGMLVDIGDVNGLADATCELLDDPNMRAHIVEAGRQTTLAYDWPVIADQYVRLLYNPALKI